MKKLILFLLILIAAAGMIFAQVLTLDEAIKNGAKDIESRLSKGVKVVVLNFNSPTERFSNYVLDEMIVALVNGGKLVIVDRQNLALIQREMNFQMSGEVSDASAQEIGMKLGAQSIISGSLEDMGNYYRIRFRTIEVVSAAIQATSSFNVKKDKQIELILSGTGSAATGLPNGLNFTTGRKVGSGFLNHFFLGAGSFSMGDWVGGLIVGGVETAGIVLFAYGTYTMITELELSDKADPSELTTAGVLMAGGLIVNLAGVVYGYIRPFTYDKALAKKNGTYTGSSNPMEHINIAVVPDNRGIQAVKVSYNVKF